MAYEMRVGSMILRLQDRVLEAFATDSSFTDRIHVDTLHVEAKPSGAGMKASIGRKDSNGQLFKAAGSSSTWILVSSLNLNAL